MADRAGLKIEPGCFLKVGASDFEVLAISHQGGTFPWLEAGSGSAADHRWAHAVWLSEWLVVSDDEE